MTNFRHNHNSLARNILRIAAFICLLLALLSCDRKASDAPLFTVSLTPTPAELSQLTEGSQAVIHAIVRDAPATYSFSWSVDYFNRVDSTNYHLDDLLTQGDSVVFSIPDFIGWMNVYCLTRTPDRLLETHIQFRIGRYAPTVSPAYLGGATCGGCHPTQTNRWHSTHHATAGQRRILNNHWTTQCNQCHTLGYDVATNNGGYDDRPVDNFDHVRCESCHGAASRYATTTHTGFPEFIAAPIKVAHCATCHQPGHQSIVPDWQHSGHGTKPIDPAFTALTLSERARCAPCHQSTSAIQWLEGSTAAVWQEGADSLEITCAVCHASHPSNSESKPASLRVPPHQLCARCHAPAIDGTPDVNKMPLHPQADLLTHNTAALILPPSTTLPAAGSHRSVSGDCSICHVYARPWQVGIASQTNHQFQPIDNVCNSCHPSFSTGFIATSQSSVIIQFNSLQQLIGARRARGDTSRISYRRQVWIEEFVRRDGSFGVHNKALTTALLTGAIADTL